MFSSVARRVPKIALAIIPRSVVAPTARCLGDVNKLNEKERGDERLYFSKSDEKLLRDLIKKVHKQTENVEPTETQSLLYSEQLREILADHGVDADKNKDFVQELLLWKRQI